MNEPGGRAAGLVPGDDLLRLATAWTIGLDAMARAAVAAVTAAAETQLRSMMAEALSGKFADWVFVDFLTGPPRRAVSAREPDPALVAALGRDRAAVLPGDQLGGEPVYPGGPGLDR